MPHPEDEEPVVWNLPVENLDHSADARGYQGVNRVVDKTAMAADWRNKGAGAAVGDIIDRENQANMQAVEVRRRIAAILAEDTKPGQQRPRPQVRRPQRQQAGLTVNDLMDGLAEEDLAAITGGIGSLVDDAAADLIRQAHMGDQDEATMLAEQMGSKPRRTSGAWKITKFSATLKSGSVVPVWKAVHSTTGMEIPKPFRLQEAAERIAGILNSSGNIDDPRIQKVILAYDKHVGLMKQIRAVRKQINEGRTNMKGRLQALQSEIEMTNLVLGI